MINALGDELRKGWNAGEDLGKNRGWLGMDWGSKQIVGMG